MADPKTWLTAASLAMAAILAYLQVPGFSEFSGLVKVLVPVIWAAHLGDGVAAKVAEYRIAKMKEAK